jgi:hypothetical protein
MTDGILRERSAESALYGFPIVSAQAASPADVRAVVQRFRDVDAALLTLRINAVDIASIHAAEGLGARLCDLLVSYALPAAQWVSGATSVVGSGADDRFPGLSFDLCELPDTEAVAEVSALAFAQGTSHWHADPRTSGPRAIALYERWAHDLVRLAGDDRPMVIARQGGRPLGFVVVELIGGATWRVPLAAIAPAVQGLGLLRRLLAEALQRLPAVPNGAMVYETQLTNVPAARAVGSLGFRLADSWITFHVWREDS